MLTRRRFLDLTGRAVAGLGAAHVLGPVSLLAAEPKGRGVSSAALKAIEAFIQRHMEEWGAPGLSLGLVSRDGLLAAGGYGLRDLESRMPVSLDDLFQIGSITKSFIGLCALQLHQEGKLDLDRPVREYLPWLRIESSYAPITSHHLLTHSSGLPNPLALPREPLWTGHAPGAHFHYCNLGYNILGLLLSQLDGRPLRDLIRARIFEPLSMRSSEPVISQAIRPRLVASYMPLYDDRPFPRRGELTEAPYLEMDNAAGCIASTPMDMAAYMQMLLNRGRGRKGQPVVSPESFARFATPAVPAAAFGPTAGYGYGIAVAPTDGRLILRHTGGMVSFSSAMHLDMDAGFGVFASVNARLGGYRPNAVCAYALSVLRAAQAGEPLPPLPDPDDPFRVPNAADYAGTYTSPDGRPLVVAASGERLELVHAGRRTPLERAAPDAFLSQEPDFVLDALAFEREGEAVTQVSHGGDWYAGPRYAGPKTFDTPAEWKAYAGQYRNENPWEGSARIDLRQGRLWLGGTELVPLGPGLFRIGEEDHAPGRVRFETITGGANGRAQHAIFSGTEYLRVET